jgi:hypothetical protein
MVTPALGAKELARLPRQVECHFVEEDPEIAARLREVANVEGNGVTCTINDGDISTQSGVAKLR